MAEGYTRQSTFIDGDIILAEHGNLEFDKLVNVFEHTGGHSHDGTPDGGAAVPLLIDETGAQDFTLSPNGVTGSVILDEDDLASDSAIHLATQQSIKAYVGTAISTITSASEIAAGLSAAAAAVSETNAATSEANAATSEANAATSEANSSTSESNAATSASEASASALATVGMSKEAFFALAEKRTRANAGSGFSEWGKTRNDSNYNTQRVNEGIATRVNNTSWANTLTTGVVGNGIGALGVSRTPTPIVNVNGVSHFVKGAGATDAFVSNVMLLPQAPDGTKTYDSAAGILTEHVSAAEAFGGIVGTSGGFTDATDITLGNGVTSTGGLLTFTGSTDFTIFTHEAAANAVAYKVTFDIVSRTSGSIYPYLGAVAIGYNTVDSYELEITATAAGDFRLYASSFVGTIANLTVAPVTEQVVTSRQDFVFLESWHEDISDKDVVYPLGNVQYGDSTYEAITLSTGLVAQGYSGFGGWDTSTTGYGVVWSTLSDSDKTLFLEDHKNNIYRDGDDMIQVRYRVRVIEGLGDSWQQTDPDVDIDLGYSTVGEGYVYQRGALTASIDLGVPTSSRRYLGKSSTLALVSENGMYAPQNTGTNTDIAHNGLCFAIPIALVQRRNIGAYHPSYNPEGCAYLNSTALNVGQKWMHVLTIDLTNKAHAFNPVNNSVDNTTAGYLPQTGNIGTVSGRHDAKFYDAIYASDVEDLRMSSNRMAKEEVREKYKRIAIAGEARGFEDVPFTKIHMYSTGSGGFGNILLVADSSIYTQGETIYPEGAGGTYVANVISSITTGQLTMVTSFTRVANGNVVQHILQQHKSASPTWTNIIGSPANISALFTTVGSKFYGTDGIEGQWIPEINTLQSLPLSRKAISSTGSAEWTNTDGVSWDSVVPSINTTLNTETTTWSATTVALVHYETQAHFTEDAVNGEILSRGNVFATGDFALTQGNGLMSSLIGKIGTAGGSVRYTEKNIEGFKARGATYNPNADTDPLSHNPINIDWVNATGAVKIHDYLTSENGVAVLNYSYKEMVYDTDWGDNNQFEIADNQESFTDDNGNTGVRGTANLKRGIVQYFTTED